MKTTTANYNSKSHHKSAKLIPKVQQVNTPMNEADYYNTVANLTEEKADYFHLQYSY